MSDDALIKAMDEAFWAPHPVNSTLFDSMRSALAVARKAILEEAAIAAENAGSAASYQGYYMAKDIAAAIRAIAKQKPTP